MTDDPERRATSSGKRKGWLLLPLVLLGWVAAAVAVGLVLASHADRTPKVPSTPDLTGTSQDDNFDRITEGMTMEVVRAVLGGPPGDHTGKDGSGLITVLETNGTSTYSWEYADCVVQVDFSRRGLVVAKRLRPPAQPAQE